MSISVLLLLLYSWTFPLLIVGTLDSDYRGEFHLKLIYFSNRFDRGSNGNRCDGTNPHDSFSYCDAYFKICLGTITESCLYKRVTTQTYVDKRYIQFDSTIGTNLENPIVVKWNKLDSVVKLNVEAHDSDFGEDDHIVNLDLTIDVHATPNAGELAWREESLRGAREDSPELKVSYAIRCFSGFYGNTCERECKPIPERYNCSSSGEKVCAQGRLCDGKVVKSPKEWDCPKCFNGGKCIPRPDHGICQCPEGFRGHLCEIRKFNKTVEVFLDTGPSDPKDKGIKLDAMLGTIGAVLVVLLISALFIGIFLMRRKNSRAKFHTEDERANPGETLSFSAMNDASYDRQTSSHDFEHTSIRYSSPQPDGVYEVPTDHENIPETNYSALSMDTREQEFSSVYQPTTEPLMNDSRNYAPSRPALPPRPATVSRNNSNTSFGSSRKFVRTSK